MRSKRLSVGAIACGVSVLLTSCTSSPSAPAAPSIPPMPTSGPYSLIIDPTPGCMLSPSMRGNPFYTADGDLSVTGSTATFIAPKTSRIGSLAVHIAVSEWRVTGTLMADIAPVKPQQEVSASTTVQDHTSAVPMSGELAFTGAMSGTFTAYLTVWDTFSHGSLSCLATYPWKLSQNTIP